MSQSTSQISITSNMNSDSFKDLIHLSAKNQLSAVALGKFIGSSVRARKVAVTTDAVAASGTVTFSSIAAADTVTIGGVLFTGSNSSSGTAQFRTNNTPSAAADKVAAASLAVAINANTSTKKFVTASNVAGTAVVTITANVVGDIGNQVTIAISAHGSVSGSGLLTSGDNGTTVTLSLGIA